MCFILPSVELSQKHVLAVCRPAPFFCMMIQVTVEIHKHSSFNTKFNSEPKHHHNITVLLFDITKAAANIPIYLKGFPSLLS